MALTKVHVILLKLFANKVQTTSMIYESKPFKLFLNEMAAKTCVRLLSIHSPDNTSQLHDGQLWSPRPFFSITAAETPFTEETSFTREDAVFTFLLEMRLKW